ncbi:MAG: 6-phosphogluconolactonase [Nocardioides sp.]
MIVSTVDVSADAAALASSVAERLLSRLVAAQAAGRQPHIGLTGGTIAAQVYAELARRAPRVAVDWVNVVLWWGDERFVAEASPDRNAGQARHAWLNALPIPPGNIHPMPSTDTARTPEHGAEIYSAELSAGLLGPDGTGEFEILLLGVGPDGHVASLFPGHPQLECADAVAVGVRDSPKPPPERITLTLPTLNRAREVWFLASGPEKAEAVARALTSADASQTPADASQTPAGASQDSAEVDQGKVDQGEVDRTLPAARVRARTLTMWFLDQSAASLLRPPPG